MLQPMKLCVGKDKKLYIYNAHVFAGTVPEFS
jgi:hypothetical protein